MTTDTALKPASAVSAIAFGGAMLLAGCDSAAAGGGGPVGGDGSIAPLAEAGAGGQAGQGVHTIMDPLAGGGMAAVDITPPPGWRVESAVRWDNVNGQCSAAMISPMFRMTSPDGRTSIERFPGFFVTTSEQDIRRRGSSPGDFCMVGLAESGEALAQRFAIPFLRPQSRPQGMRQVPLPPEIERMLPMIQRLRGAGIPVSPYAVEVTLANSDGTIERVTLGGMVNAGQQIMPGVPPLVLNQNFVAYSVRAPADQMAQTEALAARVFASARPRPEWARLATEHTQRMTRPVFAQPGPRGGGVGGGTGGGWAGGSTGGGAAPGPGSTNDGSQGERIRTIREEQQCQLSDGTVVTQSIHVPCPS